MSERQTKKARKEAPAHALSSHVIGAHNIDDVISRIVKKNRAPKFIVIDLFCGAGGTSTGFELTNGEALVIACVNHDHKAIKSHWLNHPHVAHFEEDIRTLDLRPLVKLLNYYRKLYPDAKVVLWASLECTNFSKAKGGQPRDADSRTLADHLHRYIESLNPDYVQIENVVEFMSWGPLDKNGKPVSKKNGQDFVRWCNEIKAHGYYNEWKELNSADYGAYTSRNRLFGIFARPGLPIVWPEPTHAKKPEKASLYRSLKKWMPVKNVLDFEDEGHSIFNRENNPALRSQDRKPLVDKTLARIYAGLIKYVAGMKQDAFIAKYYSGRPEGKISSIEDPAGVIATAGNQSLIQPKFLLKYNSTNGKTGEHVPPSVEDPAPVVSTQGRLGIVSPQFIANYHHSSDVNSVEEPSPTIVTKDKLALVQPEFLAGYYGNGDNISSVEEPCNTISTKDRFGLVQPSFIDKQYGSTSVQSIDQPAGAIVGNDKHSLIQCVPFIVDPQWSTRNGSPAKDVDTPCSTLLANGATPYLVQPEPFIMPTNFDNAPSSIEEPAPVITANRKHQYLVNPCWKHQIHSVDHPAPVIIARQDKTPLYLIQAEKGNVSVAVYESDSDITVKIKEFMVLYGIVDIRMRMLKVPELLKIQGFPEGYVLEGTKADQKKFIGNSVVPHVVKAWAEALASRFTEPNQKVA